MERPQITSVSTNDYKRDMSRNEKNVKEDTKKIAGRVSPNDFDAVSVISW